VRSCVLARGSRLGSIGLTARPPALQQGVIATKAAVLAAPYDMNIKDMDTPSLGGDKDVLVKVRATGICGSEIHAYRGKHPRRRPPVVLGHEVAGEVVATGRRVRHVKVGDRVVIEPQVSCGVCAECLAGNHNLCSEKKLLGSSEWSGGFGEYVVVPEETCYEIAPDLPMHHAALAEPLAVGVHAARRLNTPPDHRIVVMGAGPIGLLTVVALRSVGARHIAVVDAKKFNTEVGLRVGASFGVHVTSAPIEEAVKSQTGWSTVDIAVVAAGNPSCVAGALSLTRAHGQVLLLALFEEPVSVDLMHIQSRELYVSGSKMYTSEDFRTAVEMLNAGQVPCDEIVSYAVSLQDVPAVMRYLNKSPEGVIKVSVVN